MKHFEINIAKRSTISGWAGQPRYEHFGNVKLHSDLSQEQAEGALQHMEKAFPAPDWSLSLYEMKEIREGRAIKHTTPKVF